MNPSFPLRGVASGRKVLVRRMVVPVCLVVTACILLIATRPERLSLASAFLSAATVGAGLIPGVVFVARRSRQPFPFLPAVGCFYAVFFGLPPFLIDLSWPGDQPLQAYRQISTLAPEVMALVLAGVALLVAALFLGQRFLWRTLPRFKLPGVERPSRVRLLLWGLLAGHFLWLLVPGVQRLPSVGQFLQPVGYVAFVAFLLMGWRGELPWWQAVLVFGVLLPAKLLAAVAAHFLAPIVLLIGSLTLVLHSLSRRWFWLGVAGLVGLAVVTYVPLHLARSDDSWMKLGATARVQYVFGLVAARFSGEQTHVGAPTLIAPVVKRISQVVILGAVVKLSPSEIPYWGGETYKPLLTSFVPRALWPEKPEERAGNAFGMRYGMLLPTETEMSVNLPWITELYANFGCAGVLVGMTIIGIFLAILDRVFNAEGMTYLESSVGLAILLPLILQESNFSLLVGSLLPLSLCLWLYFRVGLTVELGPRVRRVLRLG